jgi:hypothetical protein
MKQTDREMWIGIWRNKQIHKSDSKMRYEIWRETILEESSSFCSQSNPIQSNNHFKIPTSQSK